MLDTDTISLILYIIQIIGYVLGTILLGWRFFAYKSLKNFPVGTPVINRKKTVNLLWGILFFICVGFLLFSEDAYVNILTILPKKWASKTTVSVMVVCGFVIASFCIYSSIKANKIVLLTQEIKNESGFKLAISRLLQFGFIIFLLFLTDIIKVSNYEDFFMLKMNLYEKPVLDSKNQEIIIHYDEKFQCSIETCDFYYINVIDTSKTVYIGYILKKDLRKYGIGVAKTEDFSYECKRADVDYIDNKVGIPNSSKKSKEEKSKPKNPNLNVLEGLPEMKGLEGIGGPKYIIGPRGEKIPIAPSKKKEIPIAPIQPKKNKTKRDTNGMFLGMDRGILKESFL